MLGILDFVLMPLEQWGGKLLTETWGTAFGGFFLVTHGGLDPLPTLGCAELLKTHRELQLGRGFEGQG